MCLETLRSLQRIWKPVTVRSSSTLPKAGACRAEDVTQAVEIGRAGLSVLGVLVADREHIERPSLSFLACKMAAGTPRTSCDED